MRPGAGGLMGPVKLEKVLDRLATIEKTTLVIGRQPGRQNASDLRLLGQRKGVSARQVLEVRNVEGRLHVARKAAATTTGTGPRAASMGGAIQGKLRDGSRC